MNLQFSNPSFLAVFQIQGIISHSSFSPFAAARRFSSVVPIFLLDNWLLFQAFH